MENVVLGPNDAHMARRARCSNIDTGSVTGVGHLFQGIPESGGCVMTNQLELQ